LTQKGNENEGEKLIEQATKAENEGVKNDRGKKKKRGERKGVNEDWAVREEGSPEGKPNGGYQTNRGKKKKVSHMEIRQS